MTTEWLQNLKAGDPVIVSGGSSGYKTDRIMTVERVTPTQIKVKGVTCKFRKDGGKEIRKPDRFSWYRRLLEATPEAVSKIRKSEKHSALQFDIARIGLKKLSISQLERIVAILQEETES